MVVDKQKGEFYALVSLLHSGGTIVVKLTSESGMTEGTQHALLVEDEESVRNMTEKMLRAKGFTVTTANDGEAGWELISATPHAFTFVLSDVVMPGIGGWELYEKCNDADISLPFVFMSGYTHGVGDGDSPDDERWVFLQKPFSIEQLLHCIESVVSKPS